MHSQEVAGHQAAVGALATLPVDELGQDELVDALGEFARLTAWLASRENRLLCALRDKEAARFAAQPPMVQAGDRIFTDHGWDSEDLAAAQALSAHAAQRKIRTALALRGRLPATAAALAAGRISWAHSAAIADETVPIADNLAGCAQIEAQVLGNIRKVTAGQYRAYTAALVAALAPQQAAEDAAEVRERRSMCAWDGGDGTGHLHAILPYEDLLTLTAAVNRVAAPLGPDDQRTAAQRRADALLDLVTGGQRAGTGPQAHLVIHTDATLFTQSRTGTGTGTGTVPEAPTVGGRPLDPATWSRLCCDATWQRVIHDPATGKVTDLGRTHRMPDARLRRAVELRDREACTFPGCTRRLALNIHHLDPWEPVGETDQDNLTLVCSRHHHAVHDNGWATARAADGHIIWTPPHRTTRAGPPAPRPPDPPWPEPHWPRADRAKPAEPQVEPAPPAEPPPDYGPPPF